MPRICRVGSVEIGPSRPLTIIAGPCVLESVELGWKIGTLLRDTCRELGLSYVFKASFDKANRSSINSARGPGQGRGVEWMAQIRDGLGVPVTTDIHEPSQAAAVARHVDLIQIPAFLCRQTDLIMAAGQAAAEHRRAVNVKKGQFMSPQEMGGPIHKLAESGCENVMVTERGTFFGYHRLVNDFVGVADMMELSVKGRAPAPVCFDCTHSTQQPGTGETTGGRPDRAPTLARAATAIGVHALFIECHPEPSTALSDASNMLRLEQMPALLRDVAALRAAAAGGAAGTGR
ncbi:MAG: 3-deoxy-8-phosphooctulonate synthase [Phycisphaerales bacterium]